MDPTFEIIKKCIDLLKLDAGINGFVSGRVFDRVPEKKDRTLDVISPYISLGSTSLYSEDYDCLDSVAVNLQFNCWSWGINEAYSSAEVRKLAFLIRQCLNKKDIDLTVNGLVSIQHQFTTFNRASDGVTHQASLTFEVLIDVID